MARKCSLIILIVTILFTSGCWSKREIENLAIISAVGVDFTEIEGKPKWQVTLEIYHPETLAPSGGDGVGGGGGGQKPVSWLVTSIGDTVEDAINNFSSRTPRVLFFPHSKIIVIGKEAVENANLADILALFFIHRDSRLRNWLLIADGKARDVLIAGPELEQTRATELEGMILETRKRLSKAEVLNLRDVGEALAMPGQDVITAKVEIFKTPEPLPEGQDSGQGSEQKSLRLHGASVFSQGEFAGWFSDIETRGYLLIVGKAKSSVVPLQLDDDDDFDASVRMIDASSKIIPEITNGEVKIKVAIQVEGHLDELYQGKFKVTPQLLEHIGEKVAMKFREEALNAVAKAKEYRADIFGFGKLIYRRYPQYWRQVEENWQEYFLSLPVEVEVDAIIRRTGIFVEPVPSR